MFKIAMVEFRVSLTKKFYLISLYKVSAALGDFFKGFVLMGQEIIIFNILQI
jgi:hypothetical protein